MNLPPMRVWLQAVHVHKGGYAEIVLNLIPPNPSRTPAFFAAGLASASVAIH